MTSFENFNTYHSFSYNLIGYIQLRGTIEYLQNKEKVLLLTTSNRFNEPGKKKHIPKSTLLALAIKKALPKTTVHIDVPDLKIYNCTGNVSRMDGNCCGIKAAMVEDKKKNPTGNLRCWESKGHKDDELWKITNELFNCDAVVFFTSIRWGQANAYYQKLIERLTWIQSRHTTLEGDNIVEGIDAGFIATGHNWNGAQVVDLQRQVLDFYGFNTPDELYWNWQYTENVEEESKESYLQAFDEFKQEYQL